MTLRERILGGLWGSLVGDALGVPVEFKDRATVQANRVTDMRGFGTHQQPPGTWSDDGSLLLCTVDSLVTAEFDTIDMGSRFAAWYRGQLWTPHGKVFDIGGTTAEALRRIDAGVHAEVAGADTQFSNGNGSLMRILPVAMRFADRPSALLLDRVQRASAITHRHARSQMACGFHALVVRELMSGIGVGTAIQRALDAFLPTYQADPVWSLELDDFQLLLDGKLAQRPEKDIASSGYVLHTLTASIWCLLNSTSFEKCVLKAVNLGGDTDTTGCVTGGLAGVLYGVDAIPARWRDTLARREEIAQLFERFADTNQRHES